MSQSSAPDTPAAGGSIVGFVVNERQEPVAHAIVQAFRIDAATRPTFSPKERNLGASGSSSTDSDGRFRITGLAQGEYLVAAQPASWFNSRGLTPAALYATTFHPAAVDARYAARVTTAAGAPTTIRIELVRVPGVRVSGTVVSRSGRPTSEMLVELYHSFGNFGSGGTVATVTSQGTFEIPRVPPGWYRLSVGMRALPSGRYAGEFAEKVIEVRERDLDDLNLVAGPGASVVGRVAPEAGTSVPAVGLRVTASLVPGEFAPPRVVAATVDEDRSFRLTGLSGLYRFTVSTDRQPFVSVTRVILDGRAIAMGEDVEFVDGNHEVELILASRELPNAEIDTTLTDVELVERFTSENASWRQLETGKEIVRRREAGVLPALASWLKHEDRHVRGNVAFVFAGLGDPRGFAVITDMLTDRSTRPRGIASGGNWTLQAQIRSDRYYAVHLLGNLRDPRALSILVPLLRDEDVKDGVVWALGAIGDKQAIGPLLKVLDEPDPSMRVHAIYALETLHATEAVPRLTSLLEDHRKSQFGAQVSVAQAARAAIARLQ